MFSTLRARLLASYLAVLVVALGVLAVALVLLLNARSAPPQATYQRLAAQALALDLRAFTGGRPLRQANWLDDLRDQLNEIAADSGFRILIVAIPENIAAFDSAGAFAVGALVDARLEASSIAAPILQNMALRVDGVVGSFIDPALGGEWLFVGIEALRVGGRTNALLFAEPRPQQSLFAALQAFGASIAPPVLQAACAGLLAAILLAAWISRSIARQLDALAAAAANMAAGSTGERVPEVGAHELRAVAEAFNRMSEQLETQQAAQQEFLANVSHDLKTPLTSIQGYAQAIIDGAARDPVGAANIIYDEAARLNRMVIELTDLTRLQAGRLSMRAAPIDLGALTTAVAQRLMIVARDKGIDLHVEAASMPEIAGDGDRLAQVLTNLISNAINYTPSGGAVTVKTAIQRSGVAVSVRDTGVGIPAEELPRIFERFYQVDKARGPRRGTGLGLAIVREIVAAHGGTITAESDGVNRGSTFTVWFPSPHLTTIIRRK